MLVFLPVTCTSSFQKIKYNNRVDRAEVVTRVNRLGTAMLKRAENYLSKKAIGTRRSKKRGGMGNSLKCLLSFIRSAFIDYDVEFDGVVINDLNDNDILIIIDNFLTNHKKELANIVKNKLHGGISVKKIMYEINSTQNNINKKINGSSKSNV